MTHTIPFHAESPKNLITQSRFTPQAHALMGYDILLNEGGSLAQALPQALILLGFAALGFLVASVLFKFE